MKNKKLLVTAIAAAMVLSMQATTVFAGEVSDSDLTVTTVSYAENSGEQEIVDADAKPSAEEQTTDEADGETDDETADETVGETDDETVDETAGETDDETVGETDDETVGETDDESTGKSNSDASTPSVTEESPADEITDHTTDAGNTEDITYDASSDEEEEDDNWEDDDDWENDDNADEDVDWEIEPIDPQMIDDMIAAFRESLDEVKQSQTLTQEETEQLESVANLWIGHLEELKKTELTEQDVMNFVTSVFVELFKEATADMAKSGQCGDNLQWELNVDAGKLTVSGQGDMYDYDDPYAWLDNEEDDEEVESEWLNEWLSGDDEDEENGDDEDSEEEESSGFMVDFSKFFDFGSFTDDTDNTKEPLSIAPWLPMFPLINDVTLEDGVTSIGMSAFPGCVLETLTLPSSITRIGSKAFEECDIDDVYYAGTKEDWAQVEQGTDNGEAFDNAEMHYLGSQQEEEPTEESEEETDNQPEVVNPSDGGKAAATETKHQSVPNAIDSPATGESAPMLPLLALMASVFSMAAAFLSDKLRTRSGEEC